MPEICARPAVQFIIFMYTSTSVARVSRDGICRANGCVTRQLNNMIAWHFNNNTYRHFPFSRNDRISIGQKWRELRARTHDRRSTTMTTATVTMTRRIQWCVFVIYRPSIRRHNTSVASTSCWNADYNVSRACENILAIINHFIISSFILLIPLFQLVIIELFIWRKACIFKHIFLKYWQCNFILLHYQIFMVEKSVQK